MSTGDTVPTEATTQATEVSRKIVLSICLPCYSAPPAMLQESVTSASTQLPDGAELVILPNGPRAIEALSQVDVPEGARIVPSIEVLDLVTNWNRCLDAAQGDLIHLLHEDDTVAPGFYEVVLDLAGRFRDAGIYATGSQTLGAELPGPDARAAEPQLLEGFAAARFLLVDDRHSCGNVVLTRRGLTEHGGFSPAFNYSLDEEAFLRYASTGGIGFHPAPLYQNRSHAGQTRFPSWLRPEFVREFVGGRIEGAKPFGSEAVELARSSSIERVVSVAVTLALNGNRKEAVEQLDRLDAFLRPYRSRRVTAAKILCRSRVLLAVLRARRRRMSAR